MAQNLAGPVNVSGDLNVASGELRVERAGPNWWTDPGPTAGGESLVVKHTENGRSPGVTFMNEGGGHFVQRFVFGKDSGLPQGEAASLWGNWNGLVIAGNSRVALVIGALDNAPTMDITSRTVQVDSAQMLIGRSGPNWWQDPNPTVGGESLVVKHTENGRSPGVTFMNEGGGHFVQRFVFGADSGLPGGEAASLWADWRGLAVAGNSKLAFVIGPLDTAPRMDLDAQRVHIASDLAVDGNVTVNGDVILANADCAEDFDVVTKDETEPGSVMVINHSGALEPSAVAYDKRVAGVVSGGGAYRPGIILGKQVSEGKRLPIALVGKVFCKVDASYSPIQLGDLLTTSPTVGCAMKAADPTLAFGAVIGKALRPVSSGRDLIPILVALQ